MRAIAKIILSLLLTGVFLNSCEKNTKDNSVILVSHFDTIYPNDYLPVFPGSFWKYHTEAGNIQVSRTSDTYILDYFEIPEAAYASDSFYVPLLDSIPIWGYEAHTEPISHAGSYPFSKLLYDTVNVGFNWRIAYWAGNENRRMIIARDTVIQLFNGQNFDSVIIVREYQSLPYNVPETWHKRYYAKNVGLIKEEYWNSFDSSYQDKELTEYFINK